MISHNSLKYGNSLENFISFLTSLKCCCTVQTAGIFQSPRPRDFPWARTATLSRHCPLIWAILKQRGAVEVVLGVNTRRTTDRSGDKIFVPNHFYLRTNNAAKWQINRTTIDSNVYFTVDAIMYMYVNNMYDGSVILDIQCTQVWSGEENI